MGKHDYDAVNEFLKALHSAAEFLWPCVAVPLPQRRNIGPDTIWPWTSLETAVHKGRVISVDGISDIINDLDPDSLGRAAADIRLACQSARELSRAILDCQRASVEVLRRELNALTLMHGVKATGDDYDLLIPVAYRIDRLKYGNWVVGQLLSMARHLVACIPDNLTLCRTSQKLSVVWRDLAFNFEPIDLPPDSWVSVAVSDKQGWIDFFGLGGLASRLAVTCPDPDSGLALMETLNVMLILLEEARQN